MDSKGHLNRFICIDYPGIVKNEEAAIRTLGGIKNISKVIETEKRRLELHYRPDDLYSKPTIADKFPTTGIILKVKRKKDSTKNSNEVLTEIVGHVNSVFRFESLCDFQYLPLTKKENEEKLQFIYKDIVPDKIYTMDWLNKTDVPYFLPPITFARIDSIQENLFKKDLQTNSNDNDHIIERCRGRRDKHTSIMIFDLTSPIPVQSHPDTVLHMKSKLISTESYNRVEQLFKERPIWSRLALTYESKITRDQLKYILPTLAYYYSNGPWRITWVRFGYDPRKNFESRYYQTFDYRLRNIIGVKEMVELKRSTFKNKPNLCQKTKKLDSLYTDPTTSASNKIYNPYYEYGQLPQTRQTIYQYCDIHIPEIQEMLDKLPTPISGAVCDEKTGWLSPGFDEICRNIITEGIRETRKNNTKADDEEDDDELNDEDDEIFDDDISDEDTLDDEAEIEEILNEEHES